jgi:tRNA (cytidine32/uridine32-2'-O)-methyltransferase
MLDARECGVKSVEEGQQAPVALVFGRERVGLTNEELQKCHYHVAIQANPEYSSLNLAMAVQIIAYEVRMAWLQSQEQASPAPKYEESPYPLVDDLERFYQHMEQMMLNSGFIREANPGQVMSKLRRLYTRARPERDELNILRGMLSSFEKRKNEKKEADNS